MSAQAESEHHDADEHTHSGSRHGTFKDYLIGFVLAAVLTAIPFWIVIYDVFRNPKVGAVVILIFAFVQIVVHMVYFLHMNSKSEGGWTVLALIFTAILVVITLAGSLWVMSHLDANMMPMSPEHMRNMP
ncbi:cytochrome o ubiquinol oxidase subunit IV [Skermanella stibiiresistens]|uniref:cytochrome o ubiquinol oxidase subunit IV n=1 Tax=Skermanella stibiiresistens TaxID=913326 RepID=UPI0004AEFDDE|nr:cytochrome o ubiquinol oxidase subunit IV [Skermanella stibiiresistens]